MIRAYARSLTLLALGVLLAGCNSEFSLNCSTPKGPYLLMIKPGLPWLPMLKPSAKWVTTANVYDLNVVRSDDYQVVGELATPTPGWPNEAERQTFVVNRITSEFQTSYLRAPKGAAAGSEPARAVDSSAVIETVAGTCARTWPQRL